MALSPFLEKKSTKSTDEVVKRVSKCCFTVSEGQNKSFREFAARINFNCFNIFLGYLVGTISMDTVLQFFVLCDLNLKYLVVPCPWAYRQMEEDGWVLVR